MLCIRKNKLTDILKNINSKDRANSLSYKIITEIEKLFKLEKSYREKKLIPGEIVKRRYD